MTTYEIVKRETNYYLALRFYCPIYLGLFLCVCEFGSNLLYFCNLLTNKQATDKRINDHKNNTSLAEVIKVQK